jgi:PAS domain S-box-containing protein
MKAATDKETQTLLDKRLLKVLLVEDEATDRIPVERILRTCSSPAEFVVESVVNLSEAIKNLTEKQFDVVLLDLELPDSSGIEILQQVIKVAPDIPVVVLTERDDEQTGFSALEDGATDYLVKDLPLDVVLVRTIIYALQRKKIQMQSLKLTHDINERMKELNCLYGISKLVETPGISLEEMLEKTVCLIPAGWQYPDIACAKILIGDREFRTKNFTESAWKQSAPIKVYGTVMGKIEVGYLEERPELEDGPFLKEERLLIDAIAERIGHITERNKAEETQKRLVAIIEATPDFVGFADAKDKHIIYVNKAGRKMCGIGNDEDVTKLNISDVHPEWTNKMFAEEILPAAVRDGVWTGECAFLDIRDRHEIPVSMVLSSHKASNGEVEVFSTISRDITERKQAEEALKESKEHLELALSAASMGTWRWNIKTDQDTRDASFNRMLGLKATESTQSVKDFIQYVHPDDRAAVDEEIKRAIRERDIYRIEFRIVRPDGTIYWLSDRGKVYYDQKNDPAYMTGAVFNVTERKKAEETLRESETKYRTLVENIPQRIFFKDEHSVYISCNENYARNLKIKSEEIAGKTDYDFYPKELAEKYRTDDKRIMESGKAEEIEEKYIQEGKEFIVQTVKTPVKDEQGNVIGILGVFWDITERKNKEKLILDANRRLEKVSEELSAAKRDLEQKNEALQKTCSELQQRVKEQTAQLAAANRPLGDKGYYK